MDETGNTRADEAARLEDALERIARFRPASVQDHVSTPAETADLARRLDALIAELRFVLGRDGAD